MLLLHALFILCACAGVQAGDKEALLAWKDENPGGWFMNDWTLSTDPCGSAPSAEVAAEQGWDGPPSTVGGGVACNSIGGRVVFLSQAGSNLLGDVSTLAPLDALEYLRLEGNSALHGDIGSLSGLIELRLLSLHDTAVGGSTESLQSLVNLGGVFTPVVANLNLAIPLSEMIPMGGDTADAFWYWGTQGGGLSLGNTAVYGSVAGLRALPGLGSDACSAGDNCCGPSNIVIGVNDFGGNEWGCSSFQLDVCATFNCAAVGLAAVADAASTAGKDECACCADSGGLAATRLANGGCTGAYGTKPASQASPAR